MGSSVLREFERPHTLQDGAIVCREGLDLKDSGLGTERPALPGHCGPDRTPRSQRTLV